MKFPFRAFKLLILVIALSSGPVWSQEAPDDPPKNQEDSPKSTPPAEARAEEDQAGKAKEADDEGVGQSGDAETRRESGSRRRSDISRLSGNFLEVFEPVVQGTRPATVEVLSGQKRVAMGAIVDPAGFVLTKQSELKSPLTCELGDGRTVAAYVYGVHQATDLALLKIDASSLPVVHWNPGPPVEIGYWLATLTDPDKPPAVGIVGVKERLIRPTAGFMGVNLGQEESHVIVSNVSDNTPAMRAGIRAGDVILEVNGEPFSEISALIAKVQSYPPGDEITLKLRRDEKEIVLDVVLGDAESLNPQFERSNQQNTMGGNLLSSRRRNFPLAVQHDTVLKPDECGGPVVDINGNVVGVNIARDGRVSSLMLPATLVIPIVAELKSGQLAPAVVNRESIDEINRTLQDLHTTVNLSPAGNEAARKELDQFRKDEQKARANLDKALEELDKARESRLRSEIALQQAAEEFESAKKEIERLQRELEQLVSGTR